MIEDTIILICSLIINFSIKKISLSKPIKIKFYWCEYYSISRRH